MTEHFITYDFNNNSFSNLPNDISGENKFVFTADDILRNEGSTSVTIIAKYKKLKAKRPITISWESSKLIIVHVEVKRENYDGFTDVDENLVYFTYNNNEKTIEDYKDYKGYSLKDILDRVKIIEDKAKERLYYQQT